MWLSVFFLPLSDPSLMLFLGVADEYSAADFL
jgi:hypothetical protein